MEDRSGTPDEAALTLPLVPLRDIVVFPHTMVPFVVGRQSSLLAVEQALTEGKRLFLSTLKDLGYQAAAVNQTLLGHVDNLLDQRRRPCGVNGSVAGCPRCGVAHHRIVRTPGHNPLHRLGFKHVTGVRLYTSSAGQCVQR